jgi:protein disulfide-isomerase
MRRANQILTWLAAFAVIGVLQVGASEVWLTDVAQAKKQAAELKRPILANFSGSDWCVWCVRLDKEVFAKPEFQKYAKDNLVLLSVDFPRRKSQPKPLDDQNKALAIQYGIEGYPTILLLDATGKEIARTGYRRGGPKKYVEHIQELVARKASAER